MIWTLGIAGVGLWVTYLACSLLIAKVCAPGSKPLRALYWLLPFLVATFSASALSLVGQYSKASLGFMGWLALIAVMTLSGYLVQWVVQMYIFKCRACGMAFSTYRTAWRRGIYTCPNCKRQYFKGVLG
jgi:hypothetical protein